KGKEREDSDIDVAIISKDFGKDTVEEGEKLFVIAGDVNPRIEPLPISFNSYKKDLWVPLIYEIRKKGVELLV
ncbi:nucleotidyltransferase domain-containing protein, partial [Candidatus Desantisbacteria bacterium CG_4_10_14_0_8_um_filter_39_17]